MASSPRVSYFWGVGCGCSAFAEATADRRVSGWEFPYSLALWAIGVMVGPVGICSTLRATQGWLELGLPVEALCELRTLSAADQRRPEVLRLRLAAEMEVERWNAASDTARLLCLRQPGDPGAYMQAAYCLHETGDTLAARDWLLRGPRELLQEPIFHYNIACYHAVLGERAGALRHLERAFELDPGLRELAAGDEDLEDLGGW